jgi:hypothetical protein
MTIDFLFIIVYNTKYNHILNIMNNKTINKKIFEEKSLSAKNILFVRVFLSIFLMTGIFTIITKEASADINTPCSITCSQYSSNDNNITWKVSPASGSCDNNNKKYYYRTSESGNGTLFYTSGVSNNTSPTFSTPSDVGNVYVRVTTSNDGSTGWVSCGTGNGNINANTNTSSLTASCSPDKDSIEIGESVKWTVTASGPYSNYSYTWSGTDYSNGTTVNSRNMTKTYNTSGNKTMSVTVKNSKPCTSCAKTVTVSCGSVVVRDIEEDEDLEVSCYANQNNIEVGESTTWTASVSGGTGSYSYSWSGTNSLSGSSRTVTKNYTSEGTKTATVRVTSGNKTGYATCSMNVEEEVVDDDLEVSCYADDDSVETGDSIKWIANVNGGTGSYSYSWSGTNSLSGSSRTVTKRYTSEGEKYAKIKVTSGSQTEYATCYADVEDDEDNDDDDLEVSCYADDDSVETGDSIKWIAEADGGSGSYKYSWSGTDDLDGSSRTVTQRYYDDGEKKARVKVTSGGQTEYATCYADVEDDNQVLSYVQTSNAMPLVSSVYLSDIPYTGAGDNIKIVLFATALALWSMLLAYYFLKKKINSNEIVSEIVSDSNTSSFEVNNIFEERKESENKAIQDIEDYARINKVILSSSASEKILKLSNLGKVKANEVIKGLSTGDWVAISEEDIRE